MFSIQSSNFKNLLQALVLSSLLMSTLAEENFLEVASVYDIPLVARIILTVIFCPLGLAIGFIGYKFIRIFKFVIGALLFAGLVLIISSLIIDMDTMTQTQGIGILVGASIAAILGGVLAGCIEATGKTILGPYLGLVFASSIISTGIIKPKFGKIILTVAFLIIGEVIAYFFPTQIDIVATAFTGSSIFIQGVDFNAKTGFSDYMSGVKSRPDFADISPFVWVMLSSFILLGILGCVVQHFLKKREDKPSRKRI